MSNLYYICGLTVETDLDLAPVPLVNAGTPDVRLFVRPALPELQCEWFHQRIMSDGTPWMDVGKVGPDYFLRFPGMVDFEVSPTRGEIAISLRSELSEQTIQHLFADQVVPLYIACLGRTVLHASAVSLPGGAVAFIGKSGAGKSTLAASFCQEGVQLIADDCLVLEQRDQGLYCTPSYPGLRLWDDSAKTVFGRDDFDTVAHYGSKLRVDSATAELPFTNGQVPVSRIYFLDSGNARVAISSIDSGDLFVRLIECKFRLEIKEREPISQEFQRLSHLVRLPLFRRLSYPKDYASLSEVRRVIVRDVEMPGAD